MSYTDTRRGDFATKEPLPSVHYGLALVLFVLVVYLTWHSWRLLNASVGYLLIFERAPVDGVFALGINFLGLICIALGRPRWAPLFGCVAASIAIHDLLVTFFSLDVPLAHFVNALSFSVNTAPSFITMSSTDAVLVLLMSGGLFRCSGRVRLFPAEELIIGGLLATMAATQLLFKAASSYAVTETMSTQADNTLFCYGVMCLGGGFVSIGASRILKEAGGRVLAMYSISFSAPVALMITGFTLLHQTSQQSHANDRVVVMASAVHELRNDILQTFFAISSIREKLGTVTDKSEAEVELHNILPTLGQATDLYLTTNISRYFNLGSRSNTNEISSAALTDGCFQLNTAAAALHRICTLSVPINHDPLWMVASVYLNSHSAIEALNQLSDVQNVAFRHRDSKGFVRDIGIPELSTPGGGQLVMPGFDLNYTLNDQTITRSALLLILAFATYIGIALTIITLSGMFYQRRALDYSHRIFHYASTPQLITDCDGVILNANRAVKNMLEQKDLVGSHLDVLSINGIEGIRPIQIDNMRTSIIGNLRRDEIPISYSTESVDLPSGHRGWIVTLADLRDEEEHIRKLNLQRDINTKILSSAQDAIIGIDQRNRISFINRAAEDLLEYSTGYLSGKSFFNMVSPDEESSERRLFSLLLSNGGKRIVSTRFLTGRGTYLPVSAHLSPVSEAQDELKSILIFRDSTAEIDKEEAFQQRLLHLESMLEQQTAFSSAVGHSLLETIDNAARNIQEIAKILAGKGDATSTRLLETAKQHDHLHSLANYTLEFANAPQSLSPCRYISGELLFYDLREINWRALGAGRVELELSGANEQILCNKELLARALEKLTLFFNRRAPRDLESINVMVQITTPFETLSEINVSADGLVPSATEFEALSCITSTANGKNYMEGIELALARQLISSIGGELSLDEPARGQPYFKIHLARENEHHHH